jgi:very-short-patch-repair endonuclease
MRGEQPWKTNRSRVLRSQSSFAERKLWSALRNRRLDGHKFVRQAAIDVDFTDFLCRDAKLIIEVDGATHGTDAERAADANRTARLEALGYRVLRFDNDNLSGVLHVISDALGVERD